MNEHFEAFVREAVKEKEEEEKSQCIFCNKSIITSFKVEEDNGGDDWASCTKSTSRVLQLCEYLKIKNADSFLQDEGLVSLCRECSIVGHNLIRLYEKLEVTKMWISHYLKTFTGLLQPTSGKRAAEKDSLDPGLGAALRKLLKEQCALELVKYDFPKVRLRRLASSRIPVKKKDFEEDFRDPGWITEEIDQPLPQIPQQQLYSCPFCDKGFKGSTQLHLHTTAIHPEQFLWHAKIDGVTDEQFKSLCESSLYKGLSTKECVETQGKIWCCLYCRDVFENVRQAKAHLIDTHLEILTMALEKRQIKCRDAKQTPNISVKHHLMVENHSESKISFLAGLPISIVPISTHRKPSIVPKKKKRIRKGDSSFLVKCRECDFTSKNWTALRRHEIRFYPNSSHANLQHPCSKCGRRFSRPHHLRRHMSLNCHGISSAPLQPTHKPAKPTTSPPPPKIKLPEVPPQTESFVNFCFLGNKVEEEGAYFNENEEGDFPLEDMAISNHDPLE